MDNLPSSEKQAVSGHKAIVDVIDKRPGVLSGKDDPWKIGQYRGTIIMGARGGFERDMPGIYAHIIESIARENPDILDALRR